MRYEVTVDGKGGQLITTVEAGDSDKASQEALAKYEEWQGSPTPLDELTVYVVPEGWLCDRNE